MSYPTPLAAALSGASVPQLNYWRRKIPGKGVLFAPEYGSRPRALYSYRDIVVLRMFARLRGDLSLQKVRKVVAVLDEMHPGTHLSAHKVKALPGGATAVWVNPDGDYVDVLKHPGQGTLKIVMDDVFNAFTTSDGRHVPNLGKPVTGVRIDPEVRGGYPVIEGTRIPFHIVAGLCADGVPANEIAELYPSVSALDVEGAVELTRLVAGTHKRSSTAA
ncbi:DUF433 domain-containing protein [Kribbella jiaozuonensis]|uniref:DUF433 domain-containing protein n=1 Tax=Kribbella jiaozuonensis TaxID=2575441 RepID=A0A4U3LPW5_9ACTN|nr:DUF433 domain-containing protein [Kribbella jiaozuonensis]TKK77722.1 DUF433 domain-containing protein [Kribbella jiaozuonensis]